MKHCPVLPPWKSSRFASTPQDCRHVLLQGREAAGAAGGRGAERRPGGAAGPRCSGAAESGSAAAPPRGRTRAAGAAAGPEAGGARRPEARRGCAAWLPGGNRAVTVAAAAAGGPAPSLRGPPERACAPPGSARVNTAPSVQRKHLTQAAGRRHRASPGPARPPAPPRRPRPGRCCPARSGAVRCRPGRRLRLRLPPSRGKRVPRVPACAVLPGLGHAAVAAGSEGVSAARPEISQAMTAAPRGPDLSFLKEEEARAIFQVLQRDSELRRAEKDRVRYQARPPPSLPTAPARGRTARSRAEGQRRGPRLLRLAEESGKRAAPPGRVCAGRGAAAGQGGTGSLRGRLWSRRGEREGRPPAPAAAGPPEPPVPGICSIGTFGKRAVTETALSHGCCSPWLLSFPEEEERATAVSRGVAGRGRSLNQHWYLGRQRCRGRFAGPCGETRRLSGRFWKPSQALAWLKGCSQDPFK